jgi:hypothetical protein
VAAQMEKRDRTARKETGTVMHVKRVFSWRQNFGFNDLALKEQQELRLLTTYVNGVY